MRKTNPVLSAGGVKIGTAAWRSPVLAERFQCPGELAHRGPAIGGTLGQGTEANGVELNRQTCTKVRRREWILLQDSRDQEKHVSLEGGSARQQLVEQNAEDCRCRRLAPSNECRH